MRSIHFTEQGQGTPVILLHGFPFHQKIWEGFAAQLARNFKVISLDLPGFGKSTFEKYPFSIDDIGAQIATWIKAQKLSQPFIIGHSLGGYITLSIASHDTSLPAGLILFHSTAYADTEEKKQSRTKVLEFIDANGVEAFTSNFISPLFTDSGHPAIHGVRAIAMEASAQAVKGYTAAMRDRPDRTDLLKSFKKPILFLAGDKDPGIPVDSIHKQAAICPNSSTYILKNTAHMGMLENEKISLEVIKDFIEKNSVTK
jgi:pimeloyl-ACP methyl ester carboxylesterase